MHDVLVFLNSISLVKQALTLLNILAVLFNNQMLIDVNGPGVWFYRTRSVDTRARWGREMRARTSHLDSVTLTHKVTVPILMYGR